jgi:serine/threonine protein kinase
VLLAPYQEGELVKLSDFGLSKFVDGDDLKTMCGTPLFQAPEVLMTMFQGTYTLQVDIWSLGVTLFYW